MDNKSFNKLLQKVEAVKSRYQTDDSKIERFVVNKPRQQMTSIYFNGDNIKKIMLKHATVIRAQVYFKDEVSEFYKKASDFILNLNKEIENFKSQAHNIHKDTLLNLVVVFGGLLIGITAYKLDIFGKKIREIKDMAFEKLHSFYMQHKEEIDNLVGEIADPILDFAKKLYDFYQDYKDGFKKLKTKINEGIKTLIRQVFLEIGRGLIYVFKYGFLAIVKNMLPSKIREYLYSEDEKRKASDLVDEKVTGDLQASIDTVLTFKSSTFTDAYLILSANINRKIGALHYSPKNVSSTKVLFFDNGNLAEADPSQHRIGTLQYETDWNRVNKVVGDGSGSSTLGRDAMYVDKTWYNIDRNRFTTKDLISLITAVKDVLAYSIDKLNMSILTDEDKEYIDKAFDLIGEINGGNKIVAGDVELRRRFINTSQGLVNLHQRILDLVTLIAKIKGIELQTSTAEKFSEALGLKNGKKAEDITRLEWFFRIKDLTKNWFNEDGSYNFRANFESLFGLITKFVDTKTIDNISPHQFIYGLSRMPSIIRDNLRSFLYSNLETEHYTAFFNYVFPKIDKLFSKESNEETINEEFESLLIVSVGQWNLDTIFKVVKEYIEKQQKEETARKELNAKLRQHEKYMFEIFLTDANIQMADVDGIETKVRNFLATQN